jgi:hypothetical protein
MAFTVEHIVKFRIDYKNCNNSPSKGTMTFDFEKESVRFHEGDGSYSGGGRGTFTMADMREMVRTYDVEKAKYVPSKTPEQIAAEKAKKEAALAKRRANAAAKKAAEAKAKKSRR